MLISHVLAVLATASTPGTASGPATESAATPLDLLVNAGFFIWAILAALALLKFRVFQSAPLRLAPPRTAAFLLPILIGIFIVYFFFAVSAYTALQVAGIVPMQGSPALAPAPATATSPATAPPASASEPAETGPAAKGAPEMTTEQQIWAEACGALAEVIAVGGAIALFPIVFRKGLAGAGLAPRQFVPGILLGVLGFLVVFPLLVVAGVGLQGLYQVFHHVPKDQDVVETLKNAHGALAKWLDGLFAVVIAPFAEETFFRGTLQTLLIQDPLRGGGFWQRMIGVRLPMDPSHDYAPPVRRRWIAIVITATVFGAIHFAPDQFPILFLLAVGLGYLYERTGNLFACMTVHALFNLTTVVALFSKPAG